MISSNTLSSANSHYENALILDVQAGNTFAMQELLVRHREILFRTMYRMTKNTADTEDLVQETMLRAIKNIHKFRGESRFSSWLIAIAINQFLAQKRKTGKKKWYCYDDTFATVGEPCSQYLTETRPSPEQLCIRMEQDQMIDKMVLALSPECQYLVYARYFREMPIEEIAAELGVNSSTVKSRLRRVRHLLAFEVRRKTPSRSHPVRSWDGPLPESGCIRHP